MAAPHPPVRDWATDFDHTDPVWVADPYPIWRDLRQRCPMAHTDRYGGVWLPTTHELVSAIAYDAEHFSSRGVVVSETKPPLEGPDLLPGGGAPPITSDPPFHHDARRLLLPAFSPKAIDRWEPFTRELCAQLADEIAVRGEGDAAAGFAQHIPVSVIARMMGFPLEDADRFRSWIHTVLEDVAKTDDERLEAFTEMEAYLDAQIAAHRNAAEPPDDLTTYLLRAEMGGQPLSHEHVRGTLLLILIAGIDTTWSAIGASLWHLAQHPEDRRRLANADDMAMTLAVEEFLRAYAPVTMARIVVADVELGGRRLSRGDWCLLPFPAANRDPAVFERPDEVVLDRALNRHAAFGLGIHRCLGSNLARMELRVALEEWMRRIPDFELTDPGAVTWSKGQVRGPRRIPVRVVGARS